MMKMFSLIRGLQVRAGLCAGMGLVFASSLVAQGGFNGPGRYVITNIKSGKVMDLDRNDQTTVIQFSERDTDNQAWDVERADGGYFFLRNVMNGNALEAAGNGNSAPVRGIRFDGGPDQQWRLDTGKDGNVLIINRNGKALDVPDGTGRDGVRLQIYEPDGDSNQRFTFRRVNANVFQRQNGAQDRRDGYNRDRGDAYGAPVGDRNNARVDDRNNGPVYDRNRPDVYRNNSMSQANSYFDDRDKMWKLRGDGVCFYRDRNYRGEAVCRAPGDDVANVGPDFNDSFSSVKFFGRVQAVEVFDNENFGGEHVRIQGDQRDLSRVRMRGGASFEDRISSFRVY